jgi:hypothetical protein
MRFAPDVLAGTRSAALARFRANDECIFPCTRAEKLSRATPERGSLICPTCPALAAKIFHFRFSEIHDCIRPSRFHTWRGVWPIAANVGRGCDGRRGYRQACDVLADERRRVVLIPRRWDQVCRSIIGRRRRLTSPALRGERANKPVNHRAGSAGLFRRTCGD